MTLRIEGENHAIVDGETVLASARLFRPYDDLLRLHGIIPNPPFPMILTDLDGFGNAQAMAMLTNHFVEMSKKVPIHCCVMEDNPKRDKLLKVYARLGAKRTMQMLVLGANVVE